MRIAKLMQVLLLVLFGLTVGGHEAVMGAPSAPAAATTVYEPVISHSTQVSDCSAHSCGPRDQSCCVVGQCPLGVTSAHELSFPDASHTFGPTGPLASSQGVGLPLPFRPPARMS